MHLCWRIFLLTLGVLRHKFDIDYQHITDNDLSIKLRDLQFFRNYFQESLTPD